MEQKIKIALADDEILIREGIKKILLQENKFEVIIEAANGNELISEIKKATSFPDIILMDINMPEYNGVDATRYITQNYPEIAIIALSSYTSEVFMKKMISVGAVCYIPKNYAPDEMIKRIHLVYQNGFYYEDDLMDFIKNLKRENHQNKFTELSEREIEVLKLICQQKSATEIGNMMNISPRTVDGHRNNLLLKTESKNIVGLVVYAIQNKYYFPEMDY